MDVFSKQNVCDLCGYYELQLILKPLINYFYIETYLK